MPIPSGRFGFMEFRKVLALRGPNIWANFPVLEAWVDLGALKDSSSTSIPGFNDRLMSWLPTMIEHRCSVGERGGFFQRLREGTYPAHILEHVTLELQALLGTPIGFGRARETDGRRRLQGRRPVPRRRGRPRLPGRRAGTRPGGDGRPSLRRDGRSPAAPRAGPRGFGSGRAPPRSSTRPRPAAFRIAGSTPAAWSSSATGPGSGASGRPRPTAPAPSPSRSPRTRS